MNERILFICQGNVGRSQMAEAYYNALVQPGVATSAGIDEVAEKYNGRPASEIIDVMLEDGIDVSSQRIKRLEGEMIESVGSVIVLCSQSICPPFLVENPKVEFYEIEDPYMLNLERTRLIRDKVKETILFIAQQKKQTSIDGGFLVVDPPSSAFGETSARQRRR